MQINFNNIIHYMLYAKANFVGEERKIYTVDCYIFYFNSNYF